MRSWCELPIASHFVFDFVAFAETVKLGKFTTILLVCSVLLGMPGSYGNGQSPPGKHFSDFVDAIAATRSDVRTYTVKVSGLILVNGKQITSLGHELITNNAMAVSAEIAVNTLDDAAIVVYREFPAFPGMVPLLAAPSNSSLFVISGTDVSRLNARGSLSSLPKGSPLINVPDPLAVGFGMCFNSNKFMRLHETISAIETWKSLPLQMARRGPLTTFYLGKQESPSLKATFDSNRGGLITEIVRSIEYNGKVHREFAGFEPIKIGNTWLVKRATYFCEDAGTYSKWDFDWVTVNEPLPPDLFDPEVILKLSGFEK